jgi:hypothetical protein
MANVNSQTPVRFEAGGKVLFGTDELKNIVEGSLSFEIGGLEAVGNMDRGALTDVVAGNERPTKVTLKCKVGNPIASSGAGLLPQVLGALVTNKIKPVNADGTLFTFSMTVKVPDGLGVATGTQYVFAKCYVDNPAKISVAAGAAFDEIELQMTDWEASPAITRY